MGSKKADRRKELRDWGSERGPEKIQVLLSEHMIGENEAISRWEKSSSDGVLQAARLLIEQAFREPDSPGAADAFIRANSNLDKAISTTRKPKTGRQMQTFATSRLIKAQMPALAVVSSSGDLPTQRVMEWTYEQTIDASEQLATEFCKLKREHRGERSPLIGFLSGALAEASVLLPLQRFAVQQELSGEWFPMTAHYSSDMRNNHGSTINRASDITIFTDNEDNMEDIIESYKVQVKASDRRSVEGKELRDAADKDEVMTIHLHPDLKLEEERHLDVCKVIFEAAREVRGNQHATKLLDRRTDLLLDKLG